MGNAISLQLELGSDDGTQPGQEILGKEERKIFSGMDQRPQNDIGENWEVWGREIVIVEGRDDGSLKLNPMAHSSICSFFTIWL